LLEAHGTHGTVCANAKYFNVRIEGTYRPVFVKGGQLIKHQFTGKGTVHPRTGHKGPEEE
jgi:hypothetical protein